MRGILLLIIMFGISFANLIQQNGLDNQEVIDSAKSANDKVIIDAKEHSGDSITDFEFLEYKNPSLLQSLVERFSIHDETYLLPIYYAIEPLPTPVGAGNKSYNRFESKFQVSFKLLVSRNLFYNIGLYFAYTQKTFFQVYSPKFSSPFRDSDFMPELVLYKPLNIKFLSGELYNIRFGYSHTSNGEGIDYIGFIKSRGIDRIFSEFMYKIDDFKLALKIWIFSRSDPAAIKRYMGYSSLKLNYDLHDHNFMLNVSNLVHNYLKYKGNFKLEYRYDLFDRVGLYAQYFYGYGDNLYQYNIKSQHVGFGVAIAH